MTVLATGPDGRRDETSFVVNVLRPLPPLRFQPISPQTVEAGKPLSVTATVENSAAWEGKLRYSLGPRISRWGDDQRGDGRADVDATAGPGRGQVRRDGLGPRAGRPDSARRPW